MTDALEHKGVSTPADAGLPAGRIADWSFETRLAVAQKTGLMRGYARLPAAARAYRELGEDGTKPLVTERDARLTAQVLHVLIRDLNPGR